MNNIMETQSGERLSFFKLFKERKYRIQIPVIQRDYAQGRKSTGEVRCLPKSAKPASQQMKDRKSSIKRWRKIKTNPVKMNKMKMRRSMTKKYSKKVR